MADSQRGRRPVPLPIDKYASTLAAVTGLFFFAEYSNG
jgi:hypothetical protein